MPVKQPSEQYVHTVDFQSLTGERTITYANTKITVLVGSIDDSDQVVLQALTSDGAVNLTVRRGTSGQDYAIKVLASDSATNVFEEDLVLLIREVL